MQKPFFLTHASNDKLKGEIINYTVYCKSLTVKKFQGFCGSIGNCEKVQFE